MNRADDLWEVAYTIRNNSSDKEPRKFDDGDLCIKTKVYTKAKDISDAIEKANTKLKSFGFDVSVLHDCHYRQEE